MDTYQKLKLTDDNLKKEAMIDLISDPGLANKKIATDIYDNSCIKIVPLDEICWVCPYITQVSQFRYEQYILEIVHRKVIVLNGKMLPRTARVYLYRICGVNYDAICYEKLLGQKPGVGKSKIRRTAIGYMQMMLELIRDDYKRELKELAEQTE